MGLKHQLINFSNVNSKDSLRLWIPFSLPKTKYKYDKINNYLLTCQSGSRPKGGISELDYGEAISLGGEQIDKDGTVNLNNIPYVSFDYYNSVKKGQIKNNDILLCKDGALTGKTCLVDTNIFNNNKVMCNEHIYILRGNNKIEQKFLFYYTKTDIFQSQVKDLAYKKKAQPGLNTEHFKKIKIPVVSLQTQKSILQKIKPFENNIKKLKLKIIPQYKIINDVFSKEMNLDNNLYNEFGKGMTAGTQNSKEKKIRSFMTDFKDLSKSKILRFSTRYHNATTKKLMRILFNMNTLKVKDILIEDIHRGTTPDYDDNGDIPVIKTGHLKNEYIEISTDEFVNEGFYNNTKKSVVKENDILLTSTGKVSLGKIDLLETNDKLVVDGHISIIRIDEKKYNKLFFVYFFRYVLGYFQIERDYTGATNQIDLYPNEIIQFLIPDISIKTQNKIVKEIKDILAEQNKIKIQIEIERKKIEEIIINSLK